LCYVFAKFAMILWREIIESLPDAVVVLSTALEPLAVNPAAETLFEATVTPAFIAHFLESNPWLQAMIDASLQRAQSMDNIDALLVLDRRKISVRAQVSPLFGRRRQRVGSTVVLHDLSSQRTMERALDAASQVVRLSPAGLAHEVKNPLTGIKGAAELLQVLFPDDQRASQYCGLILHGVNRITTLVEQVLAASRPARLKREPLNIHRVLHQALRTVGVFDAAPDGIVIEQVFDPSLPEISGDAEALERVFVNLLRNAIEAIQVVPEFADGRIRIRTTMETQLRLPSEGGRRRQFLRVEISDNGRGMTLDEMEQLFAPFFTTKAEGNGLGLVISQRTVALHEGKLWAERGGGGIGAQGRDNSGSDDGTNSPGMTFCVVLPFA
jgi:two-component system nitrogen regulation sensor histidine kinase GlnL